jgi:hypothetical protein
MRVSDLYNLLEAATSVRSHLRAHSDDTALARFERLDRKEQRRTLGKALRLSRLVWEILYDCQLGDIGALAADHEIRSR